LRLSRFGHKVDQPVRNEDHLPRIAILEVASNALRALRSLERVRLVEPGGHLDPVAGLAVDLDHQRHLRVGKRALIFAPFMFAVVWILRPEGAAAASVVVQTIVLLGFFLPFSYLMDRMLYRSFARRTGAPRDAGRRR